MSPAFRMSARAAFFAACLAWTSLFLVQKITLTTADLGRHLKNGESVAALLAHPSDRGKAAVLTANFYSYTHPDFPALNHHWGSGLVFYGIHRAFGFEGLCVFQLVLLLAAWALMLGLAARPACRQAGAGGWGWAAVWALWLVPVFAARREIRPEAFSVFLAACFVFLLERHADRKISGRRLGIALVVLQVLWTNLHIYFVLGPLIAAVYAFSAFLEGRVSREARTPAPFAALSGVFAAVCVATLVNPFGIRGALYPFFIFGDYGYRLVENQSIPFLERLHVLLPTFPYFKTASIALAAVVLVEALTSRRLPKPGMLLALIFAAAGWRAIRNFQLFALLALPALSAGFSALTDFKNGTARLSRNAVMALGAAAAIVSTALTYGANPGHLPPGFGIGLAPGATASADFFKEENLRGPVFNNYDIGGYLIYELWPGEKVFVDNRPEAYPGPFFKDVLIPAQEDEEKWRLLDAQYRFNVIFFSYHDLTPWAQTFMRRRLEDPDWAPVFADPYAIIFLRRSVENSPVIVRRELPRSMFRVVESSDRP